MSGSVFDRMRVEWNRRAAEDAYYYAAFTRRLQVDDEFFATAGDLVADLAGELTRIETDPQCRRALEIGCGPGRLMRPLAAWFSEIHGVDVSDRMVELARRNLAGVPHAYVHHTGGVDMALFPSEYFDFVYSFAVFQHIPSRDIVFGYLREAWRVLRSGGVLKCQINGLPDDGQPYNTWSGARIAPEEIIALCRELGCQLLELYGVGSQYMWLAWRKPTAAPERPARPDPSPVAVRAISISGKPAVEAGRANEASVILEGCPPDSSLLDLEGSAGGRAVRASVIRALSTPGLTEIRMVLPPLTQTGAVRLDLTWRGRALLPPAWLDVVPSPVPAARVVSVADGVNGLSGLRIVSRVVKVFVENLPVPEEFGARFGAIPATPQKPFCIDRQSALYDINVPLPAAIGPGRHMLEVSAGRRQIGMVPIDVGALHSSDVFAGVPAGTKILEIEPRAGAAGRVGVTMIVADARGVLADRGSVEARFGALPFAAGGCDRAVYLWDPAHGDGTDAAAGVALLLRPGGVLYVGIPSLDPQSSQSLAAQIARRTGLTHSGTVRLGRRLSGKIALSLGLRLVDRCFGTRLAEGGAGMYFGDPSDVALLPWRRLNACGGCGKVHSSRTVQAAGVTHWFAGLLLYRCPGCGSKNILTLDRPPQSP